MLFALGAKLMERFCSLFVIFSKKFLRGRFFNKSHFHSLLCSAVMTSFFYYKYSKKLFLIKKIMIISVSFIVLLSYKNVYVNPISIICSVQDFLLKKTRKK